MRLTGVDGGAITCYSLSLMSFRPQTPVSIVPCIAVAMLEGEALR